MTSVKDKLLDAEAKVLQLFPIIENLKLIAAGKSEKKSIPKFYNLAFELSKSKNIGTKKL